MGTKYVRVPFEVELAKEISNGNKEGRIITDDGNEVRIVCFDMLGDKGSIIALRKDSESKETPFSFNEKGHCVQYSGIVLCIEIPEYMTFKDGDILSYDDETFILKMLDGKDRAEYYAYIYGDYTAFNSACLMNDLVRNLRFATKYEKQKLIYALKSSKRPEAKEYLKRFFGIESKPDCKFKPFDKVLVRDDYEDTWKADFFSHIKEDIIYKFQCVSTEWKYCIPYNDKTAHLLGTTENYDGD